MEYSQNGGMLDDLEPGSRVRSLLDRDGADAAQSGGLLDRRPGERVRQLLSRERPDAGADGDMLDMPDNPGPAVAGRTPVVGSIRRSNELPVLRDEVSEALE